MPKRPEINASEFAKAIESQPIASIPFDPQMFGSAANNGQMIAEISANHRTTEMFLQIAQRLTGRGETKKPRGSFLSPCSISCGQSSPAWSTVVFGKRSGTEGDTRAPKPAAARRIRLPRRRPPLRHRPRFLAAVLAG